MIDTLSEGADRDAYIAYLTAPLFPILTQTQIWESPLDLQRRSAVTAWWRGLRLVFARPVTTLGSYFLITTVGLFLVALLGIARINSPHATFSGFLVSLALTELIAVAAIWMRIARLLAPIQIARAPARF